MQWPPEGLPFATHDVNGVQADAIEEYLCVASEVCKAKLKAYTPGPTPSLAPSTPGLSAANGAAGSGAREEKKASKNTGQP
jgi:hypothetical protein